MDGKNIGYYQDPKNGENIIRSRTTEQIRSWDFPRSIKALEKFNAELGKIDYPGIYILIETRLNKAYIGEAMSLYIRLKTHSNTPDDKIKNWDRVVIINDGRPANQSDFNDNVVRLELEHYLISLFKANKYKVVSQGSKQTLNALQKVIVTKLIEELNFFLVKNGLMQQLIDAPGQEQVMLDDLKRILERHKYRITEFNSYEATINGTKVFIRQGSKKAKGWQITFRDVFKKNLMEENGSLLMPRDGILLIPFSEIKNAINDPKAFDRNTIDVFISFEGESIKLRYKNNEIEVAEFRIVK
ncbi:MAG: GIY-YIG nuclease family protein [Bacteroidetes bacterium]|nr:GIY-YIG nuclease family protein [Bacteroidota bacterium]